MVAIVLPVTIDPFKELIRGVEATTGKQFDFQTFSAEGEATKFETAIQGALLTRPKYLVTIGSQITNSAFTARFRNDLPIVVAGAISNPELVDALETVGVNPKRRAEVAIVSDSPRENIYKLFAIVLKSFLPKVRKVGIIYNPSEINSKSTAENLVAELNKEGISSVLGTINNSEDVEKVTNKLLLEEIDAAIIPHDKNAVTKASSIVKKCDENHIPVLSLDDGTVKKNQVAIGVSVNYEIIGHLIGEVLLKIENGTSSASDLPVFSVNNAKVFLNDTKAKAFEFARPTPFDSLIEIIK